MEGGRESARTDRAGRQGIVEILERHRRRFRAPQRVQCPG